MTLTVSCADHAAPAAFQPKAGCYGGASSARADARALARMSASCWPRVSARGCFAVSGHVHLLQTLLAEDRDENSSMGTRVHRPSRRRMPDEPNGAPGGRAGHGERKGA